MPVAKVRERCCQWCGKDYLLGIDSTQHKYCSVDCRKKWHAAKFSTTERRKKDPRKVRNYWLKHQYGITIDEYEELLEAQNNTCAICLTDDPGGYNWHVDHCHDSLKVRGILCCRCNQALGLVKENLNTLERMMEYVKTNQR